MAEAIQTLLELIGGLQHNRILRLTFPNGDGPSSQLLANSLHATEALSRPFEYRVELLSDDPALALKDMQGKMMCVQLVRPDGTMRYFTGRVFGFGLISVDGGVSYYEAVLGPWSRYLTLRKDNYLFHDTTLYDQTASIFADYGGVADWDWRVQGAKNVMTDACQFDESDSNYLARRWANAGIFYWFEHDEAGHKLVLSDDSTAAPPIDSGPAVPFQRHGGAKEEDGLGEWSPRRTITQGTVALSSFDFKAPHPAATSLPTLQQQGDVPNIETYEYTGAYGFKDSGAARDLAQLRLEALEAVSKHFEGVGNCRNLMPGRWFQLTGHFDTGEGPDSEFLITELTHTATNNYHTRAATESHYENRVKAIRKVIPWRAPRGWDYQETKIHGIQSATVVGPAGEEIHTDEYGRVRVQFHWDRVGVNDDKSSAWLRVATPWAGSSFGMTSIPRVGTEVLVQFLDGNPDRPIITGMVPNADTMPPWALPANKTQSGILSRSSPGGVYENANAIRFEDKKGQEQLWLHAEKDQLTEVENDEDKWVGNDRRKTIDRDETSHIKRDRTETVDHDETITVHNDRTERVDNNEVIDIGGNRTKTVHQDEDDTIHKNWTIQVDMAKAENIGLGYMQNVGMGRMENVGLGYDLNVGMFMATLVGTDQVTKVGNKIAITAGDELSITVGKSRLVMKSDGTITFNGHTFSVGTSDEQTFKADGNISMKAKKIFEN